MTKRSEVRQRPYGQARDLPLARRPAMCHDHASYLAQWVRVFKKHPRVLLTIAARFQAALDSLNQLTGVTAAAATAYAA